MGIVFAISTYLAIASPLALFVLVLTKRAYLGLLVFFLLPLWPLSDYVQYKYQIQEFQQSLDDDKVGLRIFSVDKDVDGFLLSVGIGEGCFVYCPDQLIKSGYEYVEARSDGANFRGLTTGPGTFRYTLEKKGHVLCVTTDRIAKRAGRQLPNGDSCIGMQRIPQISAKHEVVVGHDRILFRFLQIGHYYTVVTRIADHEIIASQHVYVIWPNSFWLRLDSERDADVWPTIPESQSVFDALRPPGFNAQLDTD